LKFETFGLPSVEFILQTTRDRGNPLSYYNKVSTKWIQI